MILHCSYSIKSRKEMVAIRIKRSYKKWGLRFVFLPPSSPYPLLGRCIFYHFEQSLGMAMLETKEIENMSVLSSFWLFNNNLKI